MKNWLFMGILLTVLTFSIDSSAQSLSTKDKTIKPSLFTSIPARSLCSRSELETFAHLAKSQKIHMKLNESLLLSGEVIERIESSPGIESINIRLSNFGNALMNVSIISGAGNTSSITARIIHPGHSDALVITEENGKYYVTKHKMEFFMVE
jgi:precorrin-6B methylase 1